MYQPETTYRIQFHKGFTFKDFEKIIPYLHRLGIKTIYASPIFEATPGSMHGYDGLDPNAINPEIGTLQQLYKISAKLKSLGMGWLQDFVPNHMAYSPKNKWLCDFLEKGKMSLYDDYFDKNPHEPLMAPFLGAALEEVLEREEINIVYSQGKLQLRYFESEYPLNYTGYYDILGHEIFDGKGFEDLRGLIDLLSQVIDKNEFHYQWELMLKSFEEKLSLHTMLELFRNGLEKISRNKILLKRLIDLQFYRLCHWKETNTRINYRRFFTINGLICVHILKEEVFKDYHRLLDQLIKDDIIQGVRVDHIDGLYDPYRYLQQLRAMVGPEVYIVVEKILEHNEELPSKWPVQGTTGYDFLAQVNNVLTDVRTEFAFTEMYGKIVTEDEPVEEMIHRYKQMILDQYMGGELNNLYNQFLTLTENNLPENIPKDQFKKVIAESLVCCPVYRYYPDTIPFDQQNTDQFAQLIATIRKRNNMDVPALNFFVDCFTDESKLKDKVYTEALLHFWRRCMQLSGPLMAKGVEDTFMYNYQRLIAHNEVGSSPSVFGLNAKAFHQLMRNKADTFPLSMNATSTHDTKRGEDSRARLQLLSVNYEQWFELVRKWMMKSKSEHDNLSGEDQYFVMQAVYAALPFQEDNEHFQERLKTFLVKAAREAKNRSAWDNPNEEYEDMLFEYALTLIDPKTKAGKGLRKFLHQHEKSVVIQSLLQLILKCTCPGVSDIYQGTEFWDFSFVDPDNRSPVHYQERIAALGRIEDPDFKLDDIIKDPVDPAIKLFCLHRLLQLRKALPDLFSKGVYEPLDIAENYLSFVRRYKNDWVVVIAPMGSGTATPEDISEKFPLEAPTQWRNIFTGTTLERGDINLDKELELFPVLVLQSEVNNNKRSAGILLPLFSLPSSYGIGDMGKQALDFISFLSRSGQKLWQILPLNPVLETNSFSPYACSSAFAGDALYIDPQDLVQEGLLEEMDILLIEMQSGRTVDYLTARNNKRTILQTAWQKFKRSGTDVLKSEFSQFCNDEEEWLEDYALYSVLKEEFNGSPWYEWPEAFRYRSKDDIERYKDSKQEELGLQRWMQFIFYKQWHKLKIFAQQRNIKLVGDIPFYMSNDSADVWANKSLFNIESSGQILSVAGVPPDYFSKTGQLWGMPTYNWEAQQQNNYSWWIRRLKQNIKLYDIVRLDHFRAFYDYWEIPGNADTAIEGTWKKGPQDDLFKLIKKHFPDMPFIAEDLGEIHRSVFDFKDKYQLQGMRILQFGFEHYNGALRDLPHNFKLNSIVYTGTHDNNTTLGWFNCLDTDAQRDLANYFGYEITAENVADSMIKMAYSTVAMNLIIPMQDILGLDESNRINTPSTIEHNWQWRMLPDELPDETSLRLLQYSRRYNRL
jgi:malto-oligosyltrehalose synthase/4-alpha-glucanotransferase